MDGWMDEWRVQVKTVVGVISVLLHCAVFHWPDLVKLIRAGRTLSGALVSGVSGRGCFCFRVHISGHGESLDLVFRRGGLENSNIQASVSGPVSRYHGLVGLPGNEEGSISIRLTEI